MRYEIEINVNLNKTFFKKKVGTKSFIINSNFNPEALIEHFNNVIESSSQSVKEQVALEQSLPEPPVPPKNYKKKKTKDVQQCPFMELINNAR